MRLYFLEVTLDSGEKKLVMDMSAVIIQTFSKNIIEQQLAFYKEQCRDDLKIEIAFEDIAVTQTERQ